MEYQRAAAQRLKTLWAKLKNAYGALLSFISSISEQSLKNDLFWHFTKDLIKEKNRSQCGWTLA